MFHDRALDGRISWAAGVFRTADSYGNAADSESWNLTGRLTGLPWCRDDGRRLVHAGAGFSHQDPGEGTMSYGSRPECHLVDTLVETGDLRLNSVETASGEAALVWGPLSLQGEYVHCWVQELREADEDPEFHGYYVYAGFFLTGEHRPYDRSDGTFGRVRPRRDFALGEEAGPGAWELAVRYAHLDLDRSPVSGGELDGLTAGVNWYLNPYTRVSLNYVFSDVEDVGDLNIFAMRFQVVF
jgi:phosphate-selective porin OprO/OprP